MGQEESHPMDRISWKMGRQDRVRDKFVDDWNAVHTAHVQHVEKTAPKSSSVKVWNIIVMIVCLVSLSVILGLFFDTNFRTTRQLGDGEQVPDDLFSQNALAYVPLLIVGVITFGIGTYLTFVKIVDPGASMMKDMKYANRVFGADEYIKRAKLYGAYFSHRKRMFTVVSAATFVLSLFNSLVIIDDAITKLSQKIDDAKKRAAAAASATAAQAQAEADLAIWEPNMARLRDRKTAATIMSLVSGGYTAYLLLMPKFMERKYPTDWILQERGRIFNDEALKRRQKELAAIEEARRSTRAHESTFERKQRHGGVGERGVDDRGAFGTLISRSPETRGPVQGDYGNRLGPPLTAGAHQQHIVSTSTAAPSITSLQQQPQSRSPSPSPASPPPPPSRDMFASRQSTSIQQPAGDMTDPSLSHDATGATPSGK